MNNKNDSFIEPVISVFGLLISLATAILPLFTQKIISGLFVNDKLAAPISFLSFMLGVAIFWMITQSQFIVLSFAFGPRDKVTKNPKFNLSGTQLLLIIITLCAVLGFVFLSLKQFEYDAVWFAVVGIFQGMMYLLFFIFLILLFSILYNQSHNSYIYRQQRENFSSQVMDTLERNGILKPRIEITENIQLSYQDTQQLGLPNVFMAKKITIKDGGNLSTYLLSLDGKELIKKL